MQNYAPKIQAYICMSCSWRVRIKALSNQGSSTMVEADQTQAMPPTRTNGRWLGTVFGRKHLAIERPTEPRDTSECS